MLLTTPTVLTLLRIGVIPVFVAIFYLPWHIEMAHLNKIATLVFALAALTDWFDGYLARRLNQISRFGAFLDPVADKLMVASALIILVQLGRVGDVVALIIIGREIAVSALREWMASEGLGHRVGVIALGKIKTTLQMIAILFLLYWDKFTLPVIGTINTAFIGKILIAIAAFLTLVSMFYYLRSVAHSYKP